ncbi:MAG: hypothetical protein ACXWFW_14810 [Usitatibacter sp.]
MEGLLGIAYLGARFVWVPLLAFALAVDDSSSRRRLVAPIVASVLALVYEGVMTSMSAGKAVIRIDILLVILVVGIVLGVCGLILLSSRKTIVPGILCLAVPLLATAGWMQASTESHRSGELLDLGRRLRFETAFRDDATQRRFFGELRSDVNPWAGYYVSRGGEYRYKHLVINDQGDFTLYSGGLYSRSGQGKARPGEPPVFEAISIDRIVGETRFTLEPGGDKAFTLRVRHGSDPQERTIVLEKSAPPRFPASAQGPVRFIGVFSARYGETPKSMWVVQLWLWESGGKMWGRYLRDNFPKGYRKDFIHEEAIAPRCSGDCRDLKIAFETGRGPVSLTRRSNDELEVKLDGVREPVVIRRGETVPGSILDLAPLASAEENRRWIEAITEGKFFSWDVPAI